MKLCLISSGKAPQLCSLEGTEIRALGYSSFEKLYADSKGNLLKHAKELSEKSKTTYRAGAVKFLRPFDPGEIWGAGITYSHSRQKHTSEGRTLVAGVPIYDYVYDAKRPEVFYKGSWRNCVGPEEQIGLKGDSKWTLPEPELGVVLGNEGETLGYTISDDVSARDLEIENPLYLPQSKIYESSAAIGPVIALTDEITNPYDLDIKMEILRGSSSFFEGKTNTSLLKRKINELVKYLYEFYAPAPLVLLSTGTSIVPPGKNGVEKGDVVEITIEKIGLLRNKVKLLGR
jgi:2-dehydro-3-deoxy-D-arabinonate dehydratase